MTDRRRQKMGRAAWVWLLAAAGPAMAQRAPSPVKTAPRFPQLQVQLDYRVEANAIGLQQRPATMLAVGPVGEIVVAPMASDMFALDSTGKKLAWKVPVGGIRDVDIRWVTRIGWLSGTRWGKATMWVADPAFQQIALLDKDGVITKSLEDPSWVRPSWANRHKFPIFARVEPLAIYPDGSWLVVPSRERALLSTPEYDKSFSYLMRIDETGKMQQTIARVPHDEHLLEVGTGRDRRMVPGALYPRTYWDAATNGMRIAIATPNLTGRDSATFRVTVIGEKADTIFTRLYPFVPTPIPPEMLDSIRSRMRMRTLNRSPEDNTKSDDQLPTVYPPISGLHVGRDQTIWVALHAPAETPTWLVLDPKGEPIGTVVLPKGTALMEADRAHLWGLDRSGPIINAVVAMRIVSPGR